MFSCTIIYLVPMPWIFMSLRKKGRELDLNFELLKTELFFWKLDGHKYKYLRVPLHWKIILLKQYLSIESFSCCSSSFSIQSIHYFLSTLFTNPGIHCKSEEFLCGFTWRNGFCQPSKPFEALLTRIEYTPINRNEYRILLHLKRKYSFTFVLT